MGFQIENGVLIKYTEEPGVTEAVIPEEATAIGSSAFSSCKGLTNVTIPNSVSAIGNFAFRFCDKLEKITIPSSVTCVGKESFKYCYHLTDVNILGNITSIERQTFYFCRNLRNIHLPNSITNIEWDTFEECDQLKNVDIPPEAWKKLSAVAREKLITDYAIDCFLSEDPDQCDNMRAAVLHQINQKKRKEALLEHYTDRNDAIRLGKLLSCLKKTLSVEEISEYIEISTDPAVRVVWLKYQDTHYSCSDIESSNADIVDRELGLRDLTPAEWRKIYQYSAIDEHSIRISGYRGEETDVIIPAVIGTRAVTVISDMAFKGDEELTGITIPDSVVSIGEKAFQGCTGLTYVIIPGSVVSVGKDTFRNCIGLNCVTIMNGVSTIAKDAFYHCIGLTKVSIPDSITMIEKGAFDLCTGLSTVEISPIALVNCKDLTIWKAALYSLSHDELADVIKKCPRSLKDEAKAVLEKE